MCSIIGVGERLRKHLGQVQSKPGFHSNQKLPLTYNGENVVWRITTSFLIRSSSVLQVTRTAITSRMNLISGQIGLFTLELFALE